jgi:hypothetical protein
MASATERTSKMWKSGKYVAIALVGAGLAVAANAPASAHGYKHGYYGHGARGEADLGCFSPLSPYHCLRTTYRGSRQWAYEHLHRVVHRVPTPQEWFNKGKAEGEAMGRR